MRAEKRMASARAGSFTELVILAAVPEERGRCGVISATDEGSDAIRTENRNILPREMSL